MKRKLFQQPEPIYVYGGKLKDQVFILQVSHIGNKRMTRKAKRQIVNARPKLLPHKNCNDSYCFVCANYINRLQDWRNKK